MLFNRQPAMGLRIPTHHSRVHKQLRWPSPLLGARGNDQNLSTPPPKSTDRPTVTDYHYLGSFVSVERRSQI